VNQPLAVSLGNGSQYDVEIYNPVNLPCLGTLFAQKARTSLEPVVQAHDDTSGRFMLGRMCLLLGDDEAARRIWESLNHPLLTPIAQAYLAQIECRQGHPEVAMAKWLDLINSNNDFVQAQAAWLLGQHADQRNIAIETLKKLCDNKMAQPPVYQNLARLLLLEGDRRAAQDYISAGFDASSPNLSRSNTPEYFLTYSECYYLGGSLAYPEATKACYLLQQEFPFLAILHDAMQGISAYSLKGEGAVKLE
jgi:tetratricopeptide (TPR) repeat protein